MSLDTNADPNALFQQLMKEASDASLAAAGTTVTDDAAAAASTPSPAQKIASTSGVVFDAAFFDKIAASDAEANEQLSEFVSQALEQGHDPEQIGEFVAQMEAEARAGQSGAPQGNADPAPTNAANTDPELDAFELAKAEAEAEAIEKAIDDELEHNPLAKAAGVTRETIEQWMLGEHAGEAYFHGRQAVGEIVEKIASQVIPGDDLISAAVAELKNAGLDVSSIETEIESLNKEASAQPQESEIAKKAREIAEAEQAMVEGLVVLKTAGFDVEALVKQAEEKKKMSAGKKALIAGGTLAGLAGGGMLLKRHSGTLATKAVGAMNAAKNSDMGQRAAYQAALLKGTLKNKMGK